MKNDVPMITYFAFIPLVAIIAYFVLRNPSSTKASKSERFDFIKQASESIHGAEEVEFVVSDQMSDDDSKYNYGVVGESFQRDHLMALIRSHQAFETGEILTTAVLEPEPTNPFDSTAVKVVIEGVQVGYIAKFDSAAVTKMIEKSGKKSYEVPARIGFDAESPAPLIGVKIALTVD